MTTLYGGREKPTDSFDIFKLKMESDLGERNPNLYLCANIKDASSYLSLQTSLIPEKKRNRVPQHSRHSCLFESSYRFLVTLTTASYYYCQKDSKTTF